MISKRTLFLASALLSIIGCGSDEDISRVVQIVVPPQMPSIAQGTVFLSLWSQDPDVSGSAATLLDVEQAAFQHTNGQVTTIFLQVSGKPESGWRHYLSVEGCAAGTGGAARVFTAYVGSDQQSMVVVDPQPTPVACSSGH